MKEYEHPNYRPPVKTKVDALDAAVAICEACKPWIDPSAETLAILVAHSALETGNWKSTYNFNLGNSKSSVRYPHTYFPTGERDPKTGATVKYYPPHFQCRFRAFDNLKEGAEHHLRVLKLSRYLPAIEHAKAGNLEAFSVALGVGGYYTSATKRPIEFYTNSLRNRYREINALELAKSARDVAAYNEDADNAGRR